MSNFNLCIIIISNIFLTNGESLVKGSTELKTSDIDILRQLINQETLFRIALTKDIVKLQENLESKQVQSTKEDRVCSKNIKVMEEGTLFNLAKMIEENGSNKTEGMSNGNGTSLVDMLAKLSNGITVLLNHLENYENTSISFNMMQNQSEGNQNFEDVKMFSTMLLKRLEILGNITVSMEEKLDSMHNDIAALRTKSYSLDEKFRDCEGILNSDGNLKNRDGVYQIYPDLVTPKAVFCDMTTRGGGWTVIQKRSDGSTYFQEDWEGYKSGFGNPYKEYWLGNHAIHHITSNTNQVLRIDLEKFTGSTVYAIYSIFSISSESDKYRLSISGYSGNAGDMMIKPHNLNGMSFTTRDRDNDMNVLSNCAVVNSNGWWYNQCAYSGLNGIYRSSNVKAYNGLFWGIDFENMKTTRMMIRSRA
ncbi:techylectin-5B-like [Saccostrea cucullata]|uniref:techylectin-5B-like n=1 Tax=Saccostrea cuccullata TaxID=36930 RepID=UPI002ED35F34